MGWDFGKTEVYSQSRGLRVVVFPHEPHKGVRFESATGELCSLLRVHPQPAHGLSIQESYVRQKDLIVAYAQSNDDQYGFQLNWRLRDLDNQPDVLAIELWLSIQTRLLDTHPTIELSSNCISARWKSIDVSVGGERISSPAVHASGAGCHCMVFAQPSDAIQCEFVESHVPTECRWRLFGHFLEKGVIRRARFFAVVSASPLTSDLEREVFAQLINSPLPLTA